MALPFPPGTAPGALLASLPAPFEAGWPVGVLAALIGLHLLHPGSRPHIRRWALGAALIAGAATLLVSLLAPSGFQATDFQGRFFQEAFFQGIEPSMAGLLGPLLALLVLSVLSVLIKRCPSAPFEPPPQKRSTALCPSAATLWLSALLAWGLETQTSAPAFKPDSHPVALPVEKLTLESLTGTPVEAATAMSEGALLWRSDCALCRARLKALAEQPDDPQAPRYLANQGESLLRVARYLDEHHPGHFDDKRILLDPRQHLLTLEGEPPLPFVIEHSASR